MNPETKNCQNCKNDFIIESEDFAFYEKIKVPPPTFCPDCRLQRRLLFCNERFLYKNSCGLCEKEMISMYPPGTSFPVYCLPCYRSDNWDPTSYALECDFSKPFFEQFKELKFSIPRASIVQQGDANGSEYCNRASYNKNCYMLVRANFNESSRNSYNLWDSRDSADCFNVHKSELAYQCIDVADSYDVRYCQESRQCRESYFLFDCRNCSNCVGCVGLRNKQYYIFNKPYSKEEYELEIKKLKLSTTSGLRNIEAMFNELKDTSIREPMIVKNVINVSGNWLSDSKDVKNSYQSHKVENSKNLLAIIDAKDCLDYSYWGRQSELIYETVNCGYNCSRILFTNESWDGCHDLTYADNCYSSSNLFGCVGLRKKEFCILNRQYEKKEYFEILEKLINHMNEVPYKDKRGLTYKYGEFFPSDFTTSAYNTTAAQESFRLTKEEALSRGYFWEESRERDYTPTKSWQDLPDDISMVNDGITQEVILCEAWDTSGSVNVTEEHNCTKAFKITKEELSFYRKLNIPLPKKCLNSRHFERFSKRNPLKLWTRKCMCNKTHSNHEGKCEVEFQTSYAPERPEIVYCEKCYQQEVY